MSKARNSSPRINERGQLFSAWIMGIFIIAALIVYVVDGMRRTRQATQSVIYRELALNVAKAGFEEGLSFFRTHTSGCYLNASVAPSNQNWVTPWPAYPDAAFLPQAVDTEFYNDISITSSLGLTCAAGIIGDVPLSQFVTFTAADASGSQLWGRYVIRRQNVQNWSPGADTATVNTDPDACHDISAIAAQSPLGSGTRWSIVSKGYILRLPQPITTTSDASSLLGNPAAFTDGNLLSAPLSYYQGQPFLMAQARVYGELSRINFNFPPSAVLVQEGPGTLVLNTNGVLNSGSGTTTYGYTASAAGETVTGSCPVACITGNATTSTYYSTALGSVFPGQTWSSLKATATALGTSGQIYGYTSVSALPVFGNISYTSQISQPTFYYFAQSLTLSGSGNVPVLSGVGLCIVNGSLDIPSGSNSTWAGIIYASGKITLGGPATVNGIVISATGVSIGNAGDLNRTTVAYDAGIINLVQGLLQTFTVDSSSIVATQF